MQIRCRKVKPFRKMKANPPPLIHHHQKITTQGLPPRALASAHMPGVSVVCSLFHFLLLVPGTRLTVQRPSQPGSVWGQATSAFENEDQSERWGVCPDAEFPLLSVGVESAPGSFNLIWRLAWLGVPGEHLEGLPGSVNSSAHR